MAFRSPGNGVIALALCLTLSVSLRAQSAPAAQASKQQIRIISLLAQIADDARASENVSFATKIESQAASLLWPYDREQARAIFRRAFYSLFQKAVNHESAKAEVRQPAHLSPALKQQLLTELLNQIAACDAEMAEELACRLADSSPDWRNPELLSLDYCDTEWGDALSADDSNTDATFIESERSELLVAVALQVVERDPHRAMSLGQLSINMEVVPLVYSQPQETRPVLSTHFARLLALMRASDAGLADLLFSSALSSLERLPAAHLSDIHTLGSYLIATINSPSKDTINSSQITRFMNLAYTRLVQQNRAAIRRNEREAGFIYLIGRQLTELFARYNPNRLAQLQRRVSELSEPVSAEREIAAIPPPASPFDITRSARESDDEGERDRLYARAAFEWLARNEANESAAAALKIRDASMRDRVLIQIIRQRSSKGRGEDLLSLSRRIEDLLARADAIVLLARSTSASGDRLRASELLNEAENCAVKTAPSIEQARVLLAIVSAFSSVDDLRAFEVMQTTVKTINATRDQKHDKEALTQEPELKTSEIYNLNFEGALTALARSDFDRALLLAQQLSDKQVSLMAQIAVCRGGLAAPQVSDHAADESETDLY